MYRIIYLDTWGRPQYVSAPMRPLYLETIIRNSGHNPHRVRIRKVGES